MQYEKKQNVKLPKTQGQEDNKAAGIMTIYLIKQRMHFSFGEPSDWINLYAERTRGKAQQTIIRHIKEDKKAGLHQNIEYKIEEIKVFD